MTFATLHGGGILSVKALPSVYQGNLVVNGNDVVVIEGGFDINGSIIVEETAVLILRNAWLNFTQTEDYQFNMTFQGQSEGNPCFLVENAKISTNNFFMNIDLYDNCTANLDELIADPHVCFQLHTNSSTFVSNSALGHVHPRDSSFLEALNSSASNVQNFDHASSAFTNCTIAVLDAGQKAEVIATNSTISLLRLNASSVNCTVFRHQPDYVSFWNFQQNCSVVTFSSSMFPNVTIEKTHVADWSFSFSGNSTAMISYSELLDLSIRGFSLVSMYSSAVNSVIECGDSSNCNLYDSTTERLYAYANSEVWLVNSTCVHVLLVHNQAEICFSWYVDVIVLDRLNQNVPSARVAAFYPNATLAESMLTDLDGRARFALREKIINASGQLSFNPYIVEADYGDHFNLTTINITESKQIVLRLEDFVIPEFPTLGVILLFSAISVLLTGRISQKKKDARN
jgi:hypothetical protein